MTGPEAAERMLKETGCDAVLIGRAARGNPWIFRRTIPVSYTHLPQDVELLAALIQCEAGGEPYVGQVAVGSVVMNRVEAAEHPSSIPVSYTHLAALQV